jgi:hypothetical protein
MLAVNLLDSLEVRGEFGSRGGQLCSEGGTIGMREGKKSMEIVAMNVTTPVKMNVPDLTKSKTRRG